MIVLLLLFIRIEEIGDSGIEYIFYQFNTLRHIKELNLNCIL